MPFDLQNRDAVRRGYLLPFELWVVPKDSSFLEEKSLSGVVGKAYLYSFSRCSNMQVRGRAREQDWGKSRVSGRFWSQSWSVSQSSRRYYWRYIPPECHVYFESVPIGTEFRHRGENYQKTGEWHAMRILTKKICGFELHWGCLLKTPIEGSVPRPLY